MKSLPLPYKSADPIFKIKLLILGPFVRRFQLSSSTWHPLLHDQLQTGTPQPKPLSPVWSSNRPKINRLEYFPFPDIFAIIPIWTQTEYTFFQPTASIIACILSTPQGIF